MNNSIKNIILLGDNPEAWLAALALEKVFSRNISLTIVACETEQLSQFELPYFTSKVNDFHRFVGIDEIALMTNSQATFSLGTQFNMGEEEFASFFLPLGSQGAPIDQIDFHHYVTKLNTLGQNIALNDYSFAASIAKNYRFIHPQTNSKSLGASLQYTINVSPKEYLDFLKKTGSERNIKLIKSKSLTFVSKSESNAISAIELEDQKTIAADFYIDCIGISPLSKDEKNRKNWEDIFNFDSISIYKRSSGNRYPPFTSVTRKENSVFREVTTHKENFVEIHANTVKESLGTLVSELDSKNEHTLQEIASAHWKSFSLNKFWEGNCLALGHAATIMPNIGISASQIVQDDITRFIELFPQGNLSPNSQFEYNRITSLRYENIRDFQLAHLVNHTNQLPDNVSKLRLPSSLEDKLGLFRESGKIAYSEEETFSHEQWAGLLLGLNLQPKQYDPCLDRINFDELNAHFEQMLFAISEATTKVPLHTDYLESGLGKL